MPVRYVSGKETKKNLLCSFFFSHLLGDKGIISAGWRLGYQHFNIQRTESLEEASEQTKDVWVDLYPLNAGHSGTDVLGGTFGKWLSYLSELHL